MKLCECGCGRPTLPARRTVRHLGLVRGQPTRFLNGHHAPKPLAERFWANVDRRGPDECWPWLGNRNESGYGYMSRGRADEGKVYAHRLAYELAHGHLPPDVKVRHFKCDNPPCCNDAHLMPGTQAENVQDMLDKGRQASPEAKTLRGVSNGRAVLDQPAVDAIRSEYRRYSRTAGSRQLAAKYGVSDGQIRAIVAGTTWSAA